MKNKKQPFLLFQNNRGFTLVEVIISMALFGSVLGLTFVSNQSLLKSHYSQRQFSGIQQNIRAGLFLMNNELKKAGLDSTGKAGSIITTATAGSIVFTMDFTGGMSDGIDNNDDGTVDEGSNLQDDNGNGLYDEPDEFEWYDGDTDDPGENLTYQLSNDADNDGINDALQGQNNLVCHLQRVDTNSGRTDIVAKNIDTLNFAYLDKDRNITASIPDIRSVLIAIVGRTNAADSKMITKYAVNQAMVNSAGTVILANQNDNINRMIISTEVYCRNMGLR